MACLHVLPVPAWVRHGYSEYSGFLSLSKDMHVSHSKLPIGVNVSVIGFFVPTCQPCDELATCPGCVPCRRPMSAGAPAPLWPREVSVVTDNGLMDGPSSVRNLGNTVNHLPDCVWAPSISVINTESTSPHPSDSSIRNVEILRCCCVVSNGNFCKTVTHFTLSCQPESHLSISFSRDQTLARSSLKSTWISVALIPTLFLPGVVWLFRLDGRRTLQAVVVSKSAALNPKHLLSSPSWWQCLCQRQYGNTAEKITKM